MKFSLIYPTRNRPDLIKVVVKFLESQTYDNIEVIISDNSDSSLSCKDHCEKAKITNLKYIKPSSNLSMVENWNYSLEHATGDYICYFTDKMLLLPDTLRKAGEILEKTQYDIITWLYDRYNPTDIFEVSGEGLRITGHNFFRSNSKNTFGEYEPKSELQKKANCTTPRNHQDSSEYSRGKICFGAYSKRLIKQIIDNYDQLFLAELIMLTKNKSLNKTRL